MHSLKAELKYLFSGQGMPYEKVSIMVAMVISVVLSVMLAGNFSKDAGVVVIDLDNSAYTHELTNRIDASEYMKVTAVVNTPADPRSFLYRDKAIAVVYFPQGLEKDRYTGTANHIGVFYDNTNAAQTAEIKEAMNELAVLENAAANGDPGSTNDTIDGGIQIADRVLFSPNTSTSNSMTLGFLFFFGSMFYTFATIGMIPRLRLTGELDAILRTGTPWDLVLRTLPYGGLLIVSWCVGMAVLRVWGDLIFAGHLANFIFVQIFYVFVLGMVTTLAGWSAANPGVAASRMILIIPGGFIFGGPTGPLSHFADWVVALSHIWPLTWEFHFTRDIITRGADFMGYAATFGAFLIYIAVIGVLYTLRFYSAKKELLARDIEELPAGTRLHLET